MYSKQLRLAYASQDITADALSRFHQSLPANPKLFTPEQAQALASLMSAFALAQERVRICRGTPLPGTMRPTRKVIGRGASRKQEAPPIVAAVPSFEK